MKPPALIALIVIILGLIAMAYDMYGGPQMVPIQSKPQNPAKTTNGDPVPNFSFTDLNGKTHDIADFKGKVVLLNFWATYCAPCVRELPAMIELVNGMDGNAKLIALSSDDNEDQIRQFFARMKAKGLTDITTLQHAIIALDRDKRITHELFLTQRLPETIIIGPNGIMTRKIVGEIDWSNTEILPFLRNPGLQ